MRAKYTLELNSLLIILMGKPNNIGLLIETRLGGSPPIPLSVLEAFLKSVSPVTLCVDSRIFLKKK